MNELGSKSKNYYVTSDASFWKWHKKLKENIDKEYNESRRSHKKWKQNFIPNGLTFSSVHLSIALRFFARGSTGHISNAWREKN